MGRINVLQRISAAYKALRGDDPGYADRWYEFWPGDKTKAGASISERSSLTISALFAALNFLAGTMATLPKVILRRLPGGGSEHATDHPLYDRLHNKPNDSGLTAWQYVYSSIMHKYLWGNWYTLIDRRSYRNQQLLPLLPERMERYNEEKQEYIYRLKSGRPFFIPRANILHIPHISMDGMMGKGVIHYARESLGLAKAEEEFAATFFGAGIKAGGFVETEPPMNEETRKGLQKDFNEKYGKLGESWKAIFLSGGAKWKPNELDAQKAQALESRQFAVIEIARWTNLPPHVLRDLARATFSNIEEQALELVTYTLLPLAAQIEQTMNIAFFDEAERRTHFVKFELKGLLRGQLAARTAFYQAMLDRGVFNADMVLELEDMSPQPGGLGKAYVLPLNMVSKEMIVGSNGSAENPPLLASAQRAFRAGKALTMAQRRRNLTLRWTPKFQGMAEKIVKAETSSIRQALKDMLGEHALGDFLLWLEEFYRKQAAKVEASAAPVFTTYASDLLPLAQEEAGSSADIKAEYEAFGKKFREGFAKAHVISSRQKLDTRIREAQAAGESELEALEEELSEWEETLPPRIALKETVLAENSFTRKAFALCGITKIVSVAAGPSPCAYCAALDGKVVGIEEDLLGAGDFQPDGTDRPLSVAKPIKSPPYHAGCMCALTVSA
jgi:HK97 family phage portal protein